MRACNVVMHLSGTYRNQTFYKEPVEAAAEGMEEIFVQIEAEDIEGTNCYCDDVAKEQLRQRVSAYSYEGLHFLDSGNYHYLSLLWLEKIKEPFSLVLFDHHPDLQQPSWGEITSCGGWIREALKTNPYLQQVYMIGVDPGLLADVRNEDGNDGEEIWQRIHVGIEDLFQERNPIYISFDKDVLREEDARCDWDQGEMKLEDALMLLEKITGTAKGLLGMDICGEDAGWEREAGSDTLRINDRCNHLLTDFYRNFKNITENNKEEKPPAEV